MHEQEVAKETAESPEDEGNIIHFRPRLATGGGNIPGPPTGGNWLATLEPGTRFLAEYVGTSGADLDEYVVGGRVGDACLLLKNLGGGGEWKFYNPKRFSKIYKLFQVIEVIHDTKQIQPPGMARDEGSEKPDPIHDDE